MTSKEEKTAPVNRRDFLKTVGITSLATSVLSRADAEAQAARQAAAPPPDGGASYLPIPEEVRENLRKRGIVGYADRLRVEPGETIRFMVSSESPRYRADIVRLVHGDANPAGPGFKEIEIPTSVSGEYPGKRQDLPMGSYVVVDPHRDLSIRESFTLTAWIAPTTVHPRPAEGIITKWSGDGQDRLRTLHRGGRHACAPTGRRDASSRSASSSVGPGDTGDERAPSGGQHLVVFRGRGFRCTEPEGAPVSAAAEQFPLRRDAKRGGARHSRDVGLGERGALPDRGLRLRRQRSFRPLQWQDRQPAESMAALSAERRSKRSRQEAARRMRSHHGTSPSTWTPTGSRMSGRRSFMVEP